MAKRRIGRQDVYPNRAFVSVTQSAANTLTFSQIRFGAGLFTGTALILSRVEWWPPNAGLDETLDLADLHQFAITNRDDLTTIDETNMNVLAYAYFGVLEGAAGFTQVHLPIITDFSTLPGGGLIFPANPLFIGYGSAGMTAAYTLNAVMYYTTKDLADADYVELVQSLIPLNI